MTVKYDVPLPKQCDECKNAKPVFSWISFGSTVYLSLGARGSVAVSTPDTGYNVEVEVKTSNVAIS